MEDLFVAIRKKKIYKNDGSACCEIVLESEELKEMCTIDLSKK